MENKKLKIPFNSMLNDKDTEKQTYGCRANNPDICINNSINDICAFASSDCVCKRPSRTWAKQYNKLKLQKKID